jgi:hypothetical protein
MLASQAACQYRALLRASENLTRVGHGEDSPTAPMEKRGA